MCLSLPSDSIRVIFEHEHMKREMYHTCCRDSGNRTTRRASRNSLSTAGKIIPLNLFREYEGRVILRVWCEIHPASSESNLTANSEKLMCRCHCAREFTWNLIFFQKALDVFRFRARASNFMCMAQPGNGIIRGGFKFEWPC